MIEFLKTLWNHRQIIADLQDELNDALSDRKIFKNTSAQHEAAVQTLANALVYITTPPEVVDEPVLKPVRFQRRTYAEEARFQERQMSARFRDMDAKRRKDQAATR